MVYVRESYPHIASSPQRWL